MVKKPQRSARAAEPSLGPADYRRLADFRHVLRRFLAFSEDEATAVGLTAQQHQALLAIKGHSPGAPAVGDLAARLMLRHNSAVGLVNRLGEAGYLTRGDDPDDRRRAVLMLTRKGDAVLERLTAAHRAELRRIAPVLKPLLEQL
jgi:DNA-binding MarR family transcriptional regulator